MSILTADDAYGGYMPPLTWQDWTTDMIDRWVDMTMSRYVRDEFYRQWSLADMTRHRSTWFFAIHDDLGCWEMRMARLRQVMRAIGDPRAEQDCPPPDWLDADGRDTRYGGWYAHLIRDMRRNGKW